jgi:hypothetical protein
MRLLLLLITISSLFSQHFGFTGSITVSDSLIGFGLRVIYGQDTSYTDQSGRYELIYSPVSISEFTSPKINLLNNVSPNPTDGYMIANVQSDESNLDYRLYNLNGRQVETSKLLSRGVYILQVLDGKKLLGTQKFCYMGSGEFTLQFEATSERSSLKKLSNREQVSFKIETPVNNQIAVFSYESMIEEPESMITLDLNLDRVLRPPVIDIVESDFVGTIDETFETEYSIYSLEFDTDSLVLEISQTEGVETSFDTTDQTFSFTTETSDNYEFNFTVIEYPSQIITESDISATITSQMYRLRLTKLFYGLGDGAEGLMGQLIGDTSYSDESGLMPFEFQDNTLSGEEFITITSPELGSLQDSTGRFADLEFQIVIDNTEEYMTFTDPQEFGYWNEWVWNNQIQREIYLSNTVNFPNF